MVLANVARSTELVIIISYPTSASGIIVLLKTPTKSGHNFVRTNRKDKGLPLFTCDTSIKTVNARKDRMNEKSKHVHLAMNTFKKSSGF